MRFKIWSILVIFVMVLFISSTEVNAQCDDGQKIFDGPGVDWLLKKVKKPYTLDELAKIFRARNITLSTHFANDGFEHIGKYYGQGGMVRDGGKYIFGGPDISAHFRKLKEDRNVNAVIFDTVRVYIDVDEYMARNAKIRKETDYVFTLIEIISISYIVDDLVITEISSRDGPHPWITFRNGDWPGIRDFLVIR